MKIQWKLFKNLLCCGFFLSNAAFAQSLQNVMPTSSAQMVKVAQDDSSSSEIQMTVSSLDIAWSKRESEEEQNMILAWLQTEPKVPQNFDIAWRIARLVYFSGNFGLGEQQSRDVLVKLYSYGYKAGELAKILNSNRVEGHYWYAVDLGSYGLAKGVFKALTNAPIGRDALLEAAKIDASYQWGGPYRVLGRYYQELPSVLSFGDKKIAQQYFEKAIDLGKNYALNKIYLGILKKELGDKEGAKKLFLEAQKLPEIEGKEEERHHRQKLALELKKLDD